MKEFLTPDDLFSEVQMIRDTCDGAILLLEGQSDWQLFRFFVDEQSNILLQTHGKDNALRVAALLDTAGTKGFAAIVDADFWHLDKVTPTSSNVLVTDYHDIEVMLLSSKALTKLLDKYASQQKISLFLRQTTHQHILDALFLATRPLGLLRLVSSRAQAGLNFEGIRIDHFVDKTTLQISIARMIRAVVNNTAGSHLTDAEIRTKLAEIEGIKWDCRQLCCGHDVIHVLAIGLRKALGSCRKDVADPSNIESVLRIGYDTTDFRRSRLFRSAANWARRNRPFVLFPSR
jgi:hypothetical protein